jgi:hypothetical protein
MHPVDKVHVGVTGRPKHDPIAGGAAEPGMRGLVLLADVRLDLYDPPDPPTLRVVTDEERPEERAPGGEGWAGQDRPVRDRSVRDRSVRNRAVGNLRWRQRNR